MEQQRDAAKREAERREQETISILSAAEEARRRETEARKTAEEDARRADEQAARKRLEARRTAPRSPPPRRRAGPVRTEENAERRTAPPPPASPRCHNSRPTGRQGRHRPVGRRAGYPASLNKTLRLAPLRPEDEDEGRPARRPGAGGLPARKPPVVAPKGGTNDRRRAGRIDVQAAIEGEDEKVRSLASVRRQRERERRQAELDRLRSDQVKVVRDVILPETITVQELANRMAARTPEVIKALMKMGVMATLTQTLDADTAELVVQEFGHRVRRVAELDVELGLEGDADVDDDLFPARRS